MVSFFLVSSTAVAVIALLSVVLLFETGKESKAYVGEENIYKWALVLDNNLEIAHF